MTIKASTSPKYFVCNHDGSHTIADPQPVLIESLGPMPKWPDDDPKVVALAERVMELEAENAKLREACKKFLGSISIMDDGPDDSDIAHAQAMIVEGVKLARAALGEK